MCGMSKQSRVQGRRKVQRYLDLTGLVLLFFALGLMCKPMLVTLPFVLLLLDYWPLGRVTGDKWQVTGEKKGKPLDPQPSTLNLAS